MKKKRLIRPSSALSERLLRFPLRMGIAPALALCLCLLAGGASAALAQTTGSATSVSYTHLTLPTIYSV